MGKNSGKMYVVRHGRTTGVFSSWAECEAQVKGFSGAQFKSFTSSQAASAYMDSGPAPQARPARISAPRAAPRATSYERSYRPQTSYSAYNYRRADPTPAPRAAQAAAPVSNPYPAHYYGAAPVRNFASGASSSGSSSSKRSRDTPRSGGSSSSTKAHKARKASSRSAPSNGTVKDGSLVIYTDGSCIGNKNVAKQAAPAGWGFVALDWQNSDEQRILHENCGPVVVDKSAPGYLGAEHGSNNTAELTGIAQALKYVKDLPPDDTKPVVIRYDSVYAAKSVTGEFNGDKNRELIMNCRQLLAEAKAVRPVEFVHVRGHSDDKFNDRADHLAKRGAGLP